MLLLIAWRNIWRNKLRSSIVIISITLGIWAGIFVMGLSVGLTNQRMENTISSYISHIQIHNPDRMNIGAFQVFFHHNRLFTRGHMTVTSAADRNKSEYFVCYVNETDDGIAFNYLPQNASNQEISRGEWPKQIRYIRGEEKKAQGIKQD